jgi:hypothetical protein
MDVSREEFARIATEYLRRMGEQRPAAWNEGTHSLTLGTPEGPVSFIYLGHAQNEYQAAAPFDRERVLSRRFWSSLRTEGTPPVEVLQRQVLPRLRDRAWFSAVRRQAELELGADEEAIDEVMIPHFVLNSDLAAHLSFELPSSSMELSPDRLEAWGADFDALFARAVENLRERSVGVFEEPQPGVFVSPWRDALDATRMVLVEQFRALKVKGSPVLLAPTHDIVLVTGDGDEAGLATIAGWAEEALMEPRTHSAIAFRLEGARWVAWLPPREHPAFGKFKLLQLQTLASTYARQKEVLEPLLEANGHAITVGTLRAFRSRAGDVFTSTAWTAGAETLLPRTDRIDLIRPAADGDPNHARTWSTSWEVAQQVVGRLMQPIGDTPERWRVAEFPSDAELEQLATLGRMPE